MEKTFNSEDIRMNGDTQKQQALDDEALAHQERTSRIRFKQNMVHGIGAATVFGLVAAGGSALLKIATLSSGVGLVASGAMVALAVVGIGCLYLSSKYTSELVGLEQSRHATQIAKGITGVGQVVEPQKPVPYPSHSQQTTPDAVTVTAQPSTVVDQRAHAGRAAGAVEHKAVVV